MTVRAATPAEYVAARDIFREYARSLPPGHICFQDFEKELMKLNESFAVIMIAIEEGYLAGCVGVRHLAEGICEMKRLFVRHAWRRRGLGRSLVVEAIAEARKLGYRSMRLDTLSEFTAAAALYNELGFYRIPAYANQPPEVLCFELPLDTKL